MKIDDVQIRPEILDHFSEHGVDPDEIEYALKEKSYITRTAKGRYMAIACTWVDWITVIFEYRNRIADVITAYRSSDWQIKLYKNKMK